MPSFPNWYESLEGSLSRQFDKRLFLQSVEVPGTHINAIAEACGRGAINAVIGINERLPGTTAPCSIRRYTSPVTKNCGKT
ncbi:hypothetical protein [Enterobacter cloacae complex sp. 285F6]|uniref:hypothetical protein n=1 Tax=Enterobacter cloacae complex sp. 285F6 TaxID=3395831 RepID=UPI003CEBF59D